MNNQTSQPILTLLPILALLCVSSVTASSPPPNIVLIMADDLGYQELGCYGQQKIKTPHVDRLAREGKLFTQFYSGSPVCAPSRCVLLTGRHSGHVFIRDNGQVGEWGSYEGQTPLPAGTPTIARTLKQAGYVTGVFGKWGLGGVPTTGNPLKQGFDRFYGYNCQAHAHNLYPKYLISDNEKVILTGNTRGLTGKHYAPQLIADQMLDFVKTHQQERFFVYYATVLPHLALQAPEEWVAKYRGEWPETPYTGKSYLPHPTPRACYAAMISFMDFQVGRLMALLNELELDDNTLVLFTSDNGATHLKQQVDVDFFASVGSLNGLKGSLYEGGIRVPLITRWPGRIAPQSNSDFISASYDILPTLAAVARTSVPPQSDGLSFLPTLLGEANQSIHDYLYWDFPGYGGQIAVRMGPWKALRRNLRKQPDAPLELYHLEQDPGESRNLAEKHPKIATQLERILREGRTRPSIQKFQHGEYHDEL